MMGVHGMNGATGPQPSSPQGVPHVMSMETPVAYYQPIAITPATVKWVIGAVIGILVMMPAGVIDRYLNPAGRGELDALVKVVQTVQQAQDESRRAVERLTVAVDNLSGIVNDVREAGKIVKNTARTIKPR
jgi:hypothetical protein